MKNLIFLFIIFVFSFRLEASKELLYPHEYNERRAELIEQSNSFNFASHINLSEKEAEVNEYLIELQKHEFNRENFLPEYNFLKVRDEIVETPLYKFLQDMPKGAILHAHTSALGDFKWLVKTASYRLDCYVYVGEDNKEFKKGMMKIVKDPPEGDWKPVQQLRSQSKDVEQFDQDIYESFTMNPKDLDGSDPWEKFQQCFYNFMGLFSDKALYKTFVKNALIYLIEEDHLQYVELRDSRNDEEYIEMYLEIIKEIQEVHPYFKVKIIGYGVRNQSPKDILNAAKHVLQMRKKYPEIIAGFDIVAGEDSGHSTLYYIDELLNIKRLAAKENISFSYFLHNGETDWPFGNYIDHNEIPDESEIPYNENMYDVFLLESKRVGHGLSLIKNPFLMNKFKKADIALEICPISNQILFYVDDMRNHPALTYLNAGLAVTINPDDPGLFGYQGVTADYWEACVAWQLDLRALKKLIMNSISYSSLSSKDKEVIFNEWSKQWDGFIDLYYDRASQSKKMDILETDPSN